MKTDATLKKDVLEELDWEPSIDATQVGVTVKDGIVTLSGHVNTYSEKAAAEKAAKRVKGIKAVVEEIDVKLGGGYKRTDQDIAQSAVSNLKWHSSVPEDDLQVRVENGWITLEGKVEWKYQKDAAKNAIQNLMGVRGVTNLIEVQPTIEPTNVKQRIREALERNALTDADNISVHIEGSRVELNGIVQSWSEKKQAENAAWAMPGVSEVQNNLKIKVRELVH